MYESPLVYLKDYNVLVPVCTGQAWSFSYGQLVFTKLRPFVYFSVNEKYSKDLSGQFCGVA